MNALTQMITQQLAGGAVRTISQRLGVSETTANTAVQIAVPLILSALARNAAQPQGAESLHEAISKDHDGSILNNLRDYLGDPQSANGAGILGHVFGSQQPTLENNLAQALVFGPRVGAAYDVTGTHRVVLRGSVGVFYDRLQGDSIFGQIGNPPTGQGSTVVNSTLQQVAQGGVATVPNLPASGFDLLRPLVLTIANQHLGAVDFSQRINGRPRGLDFLIEMFRFAADVQLTEANFKKGGSGDWHWKPWIGLTSQEKSWCGTDGSSERSRVPDRTSGTRPRASLVVSLATAASLS